ncbi:MAG: hypothetical protein A3K61_03295 [Thaumarchaeota archaeon RBG_16_49_8]|nr:MAG: hypothetical protein A3K61_03295 [Thaumarchaeota archaeon RBG_16_49_8]
MYVTLTFNTVVQTLQINTETKPVVITQNKQQTSKATYQDPLQKLTDRIVKRRHQQSNGEASNLGLTDL